jgi:voltage-gated potassium channel
VVIERREALLAGVRDAGGHAVAGDATEDATLRQAGIEHARALLAVTGSDAENVIITMTARLLRPTVPIIARAEEEVALPKLHRAGATRIVSPAAMIAGRMAAAVLRPAVLDFMDLATSRAMSDLQLEEQPITRGSPLDGQTVGGSGLRARPGLILVAIMRRDGGMSFDPRDDAAVAAGDTLILLRRPKPPAPARARL